MEIERKFLLERFPQLPVVERLEQWQGYLSTEPEVRLRRTRRESDGGLTHILCVKSRGTLQRHEVELPMTQAQFEELAGLLEHPLIHKAMTVFRLPEGYLLECSVVDGGVFSYAEVEFPTEAEALAWCPPDFLGRELTWQTSFRMSSYWTERRVTI